MKIYKTITVSTIALSVLIASWSALPSHAATDVKATVSQLMEQYRQNSLKHETIKAVMNAPREEAIAELETYLTDKDEDIRGAARSTIRQIAEKSPEQKIRQRGMSLLLKVATSDPSYAERGAAAAALLHFHPSDFTEEMKKTILAALEEKRMPAYLKTLAGWAYVHDAKTRLQQLAVIPPNSAGMVQLGSNSWDAFEALARLGDRKAIQFCIDMIEAEKEDRTRRRFGAESLAYIRQPQTIDLLIRYAFYEGRAPTYAPSDMGTGGEPWAYFAIERLAGIVEGMPWDSKPAYSPEEVDQRIAAARKWLTDNQRKLKIKP